MQKLKLTSVDQQALDANNNHAADFTREWDEQPPPADMQAFICRYVVDHG